MQCCCHRAASSPLHSHPGRQASPVHTCPRLILAPPSGTARTVQQTHSDGPVRGAGGGRCAASQLLWLPLPREAPCTPTRSSPPGTETQRLPSDTAWGWHTINTTTNAVSQYSNPLAASATIANIHVTGCVLLFGLHQHNRNSVFGSVKAWLDFAPFVHLLVGVSP